MTRIESTSTPSSQTPRTNRSTRTAVLPVPAPAETKTRPFASIASSCSGFGVQLTNTAPDVRSLDRSLQTAARAKPVRPEGDIASDVSRSLHPAHRPEIAPRGALAALRVMPDVSGANVAGELACRRARRLDLRPESILVEVVVARVACEDVAFRVRAEQPPRTASRGQRAVEAAQRLDPDEVAEDEHVERDLEPELLLHLARRGRVLPGLVVLDESALELGRRAIHPERDLDLARLEGRVGGGLGPDEPLEVA